MKFKALIFASDKVIANKKKEVWFLEKVKNIVGKGENAGYQYFVLFPH